VHASMEKDKDIAIEQIEQLELEPIERKTLTFGRDTDTDNTARRNTRFRPTTDKDTFKGFATSYIDINTDTDVEDDGVAVREKDEVEVEDDTPPSFPTPLMSDTNASDGGSVDMDGEAEADDETVTTTCLIIKYKRQQRTQFRERVQQLLTRQQQQGQDNDADADLDAEDDHTSINISTVGTEFGLRQPSGTNTLKPKNGNISNIDSTPRDPMRNGLRPAGNTNNNAEGFAGTRGNGNVVAGGRKFKRRPRAQVNHEFEDLDSIVMTLTKEDLDYLKSQSSGMIESMEVDAIRMPFYDYDHASILDGDEDEDEEDEQDTTSNSTSTNINITYGVTDVQAPELWGKGLDGSGQKVCIIDSGVDLSHPDFNGTKFTGTNQRGVWNQDQCGHGTHVAGVIAAKEGSVGVTGIAYNANVFIVRVFSGNGNGCGWMYSSGLMAAAGKCRIAGATIINMSLGGRCHEF
jgi:subtilisin family serine protease